MMPGVMETIKGRATGIRSTGVCSTENSRRNLERPRAYGAVRVSLRVTSGGAALMHEMVLEGRSDDPSRRDDDSITMLYIDGDRLILPHYCDSGKNRPRMVGRFPAREPHSS